MRSVLISGGSGFLGRHLTQELLARGEYARICIYSRDEVKQAKMREEFQDDSRLRWFIGDVRDYDRLERAMDGCELVIHGAALKRIELAQYCPDELVKTNVLGSMNVVNAAAKAGVEKAVLVSSDKAYQPISAYGQTKAIAESLFLSANNMYPHIRYSVVRYGNVWRSTGSVVPIWEQQISEGKAITVTDPECTRFYMTIDQAVDIVLETAETMEGGETNVPDLPAYQLHDLAWAMGRAAWKVTGLPDWEKRHENMDDDHCSKDARRMTIPELEEALRGQA